LELTFRVADIMWAETNGILYQPCQTENENHARFHKV